MPTSTHKPYLVADSDGVTVDRFASWTEAERFASFWTRKTRRLHVIEHG